MKATPSTIRRRRRFAAVTAVAVGLMAAVPTIAARENPPDTVAAPLPSVERLQSMAASSAVPANLMPELKVVPEVDDGPTEAEEVEAALEYLAAITPASDSTDTSSAPSEPAAPSPPPPEPQPVDVPSDTVHQAILAWFGDAYSQAVAIADCESGLNPNAVSPGGGNWGLFQINVTHQDMVEGMGYSWDQILDPWVNTEVAYTLYAGSGWGPWACKWVL